MESTQVSMCTQRFRVTFSEESTAIAAGEVPIPVLQRRGTSIALGLVMIAMFVIWMMYLRSESKFLESPFKFCL